MNRLMWLEGLMLVATAWIALLLALFRKWVRRLGPDGVRALKQERPMPGMPEGSDCGAVIDASEMQRLRATQQRVAAAFNSQQVADFPLADVANPIGQSKELSEGPRFPVPKSLQPFVFHSADGSPMPTRQAWGDVPYDELAPMFLDQFLLRYFPKLMEATGAHMLQPEYFTGRPWKDFVAASLFQWGKDMPLLFEQLTSHKLNDLQLDQALGEFVSRLLNSPRAETQVQPKATEPPEVRCLVCGNTVMLTKGLTLRDHQTAKGGICLASGAWAKPPVVSEAESRA
jgi:hypothetical protein